jgi:hypothetical protein
MARLLGHELVTNVELEALEKQLALNLATQIAAVDLRIAQLKKYGVILAVSCIIEIGFAYFLISHLAHKLM